MEFDEDNNGLNITGLTPRELAVLMAGVMKLSEINNAEFEEYKIIAIDILNKYHEFVE